jgi:hypothetical protein
VPVLLGYAMSVLVCLAALAVAAIVAANDRSLPHTASGYRWASARAGSYSLETVTRDGVLAAALLMLQSLPSNHCYDGVLAATCVGVAVVCRCCSRCRV